MGKLPRIKKQMGEINSKMGRFAAIKKQNGKIWSSHSALKGKLMLSHFAFLLFLMFCTSKDVNIETILKNQRGRICLVLCRFTGVCRHRLQESLIQTFFEQLIMNLESIHDAGIFLLQDGNQFPQ